MLSVAYAASIGGLGTLVGSPPNIQMAGILEKNFGITVSFFDWMKVAMPMSILLLLLAYFVFYIGLGKERNDKHDFKLEKQAWTSEQLRALAVFGCVAVLWIFKDLINDLTGLSYKDESAAVLGAVVLFIIPQSNKKKTLLEWQDTEKLPWGILLLFGGGLALAAMLEKNGIVDVLIEVFKTYKDVSVLVMITIIVLIGIFASEVLSNLALVVIFVPIVATFAQESGYSVLQLCLPLTFGASCAFMMPVGTPPNAIAYSSGYIKMNQMIKYGFVMNIISGIVMIIFGFLFI